MRIIIAAALAALTLGTPATAEESLEEIIADALELSVRINAMKCVVETTESEPHVRDFTLLTCYLYCGLYADDPMINVCSSATIEFIEDIYPHWIEEFEGTVDDLSY